MKYYFECQFKKSYIALDDNKIIGLILTGSNDNYEIYSLHVLQKFQFLKIGSNLMTTFLKETPQAISYIVKCLQSNSKGLNFYQKFNHYHNDLLIDYTIKILN